MTKRIITRKTAQSHLGEHEFQNMILNAMKNHTNILLFRRNTGAAVMPQDQNGKRRFLRFSEAGQSDLWGLIREYKCPECGKMQYGVHVEIELKTSKGELSQKQSDWIKTVSQFNGIACVMRPNGNEPFGIPQRFEQELYSSFCPECFQKEFEDTGLRQRKPREKQPKKQKSGRSLLTPNS